jgi:3',5'-nucleoside bisphosphate phosphatase
VAQPDPEEVSATGLRVDLHSHSSVSDGLDSPAELVARMAEAGVGAFALTDHDTLGGLPEAREEARRLGIELIPGAEISANSAGEEDVHILALFVDEASAEFNAHLTERQEGRRRRGERMAEKLVEAGFAIDLGAIRADVGDGVWGRPHIARALIRAGYAASNDEAFDRFLGTGHPWYVPHDKWAAADVLAAVHRAGGVCSLAHAVWYSDAETVIAGLAAHGLDAVEVFHPDHGTGEVERFGRLARELGLVATAGSDFHGSIEGRKFPGGVSGDERMLEALRARKR